MEARYLLIPIGAVIITMSLALMFYAQEPTQNNTAFLIGEKVSPLGEKENPVRGYGLLPKAFAALPVIPDNFQEKAKLSNKNISENVFKQPEFIHNNWFENNCLEYYKTESNYSGVIGWGFYPNYKRIVLENGSTEFETEFFVHSACGIEVFQSIHLVKSDSDFVFVELDKSDFVLEPTVPEIHFDWIHKIKVTGRIKQGTPNGTYIVSVNPESLFGIGKNFFELRVVVQ